MNFFIMVSLILSVLLGIFRGIDLALLTDAETGLCIVGSVWLRYGALAVAVLAALLLYLSGCGVQSEPEQLSLFAMDTYMTLAAYGDKASEALAACGQELNRLDGALSRTREGSEIYTLNAQGSADVSQETADLISAALTLSQATGGAFDPTVAPLVTLWGITTDSPRVPQQTEIDALLPLVGVDHVTADGTHITLDPGCAMDLGGIAKGYASDRLADIFAQYGVDSALVSLGGNVYARGAKPGGQAWSVAVQHPEQEGYAAMLALTDAFAVTSGGYQRYFTGPDGTVYQHILNPKTGWPVQGDLLSVTIVADNGTMADAYSTALYVMGREAAQDFWRQNGGFDMVLITKDGQVLYTPGLADKLTETEGSGYAYASIEP